MKNLIEKVDNIFNALSKLLLLIFIIWVAVMCKRNFYKEIIKEGIEEFNHEKSRN